MGAITGVITPLWMRTRGAMGAAPRSHALTLVAGRAYTAAVAHIRLKDPGRP